MVTGEPVREPEGTPVEAETALSTEPGVAVDVESAMLLSPAGLG
jgi:hypothetical protein